MKVIGRSFQNRLRLILKSIEVMIPLELELETPKKNLPPFSLLLQSNTLGSEWKINVSLCVQLVRISDGWSVFVYCVGNVRYLLIFEISNIETNQRTANGCKSSCAGTRPTEQKTESQGATETGAQKCFEVAWQRRFLWRRGAA